MLTLHAPAKVNLHLQILARETSGFHQLETVFASLEFGDTLSMSGTASGVSLATEGPSMGPLQENLAYRAAVAFLERSRVDAGVEIRLSKRIPVGGGLGGGSSDAAITLLGLQRLFPGALSPGQVIHLAGSLGSDVPFFLCRSPLALAWGRGDRILPLAPLPTVPVLLALPQVAVATADAYRLLAAARAEVPRAAPARIHSLDEFSSWKGLASLARNDFEDVVLPAHPYLGRLREGLNETNPVLSLLSGSGAALFAVYEGASEAWEGKGLLEERFPETRFVLTRTLGVDQSLSG
jgi:4-diphosphocytidyl-2-C-methyl-D-erythritol kinase